MNTYFSKSKSLTEPKISAAEQNGSAEPSLGNPDLEAIL